MVGLGKYLKILLKRPTWDIWGRSSHPRKPERITMKATVKEEESERST